MVDREEEASEVGLSPDGGDQWREQIFDQCGDHVAERNSDHHSDGQVHHVSPQQESLELAKNPSHEITP